VDIDADSAIAVQSETFLNVGRAKDGHDRPGRLYQNAINLLVQSIQIRGFLVLFNAFSNFSIIVWVINFIDRATHQEK